MAGITHLKQFQKDSLRGVVDQTLQELEPSFADRYLPNQNVFSNTFAYDIIKTNKYIGAMIGYGSEPPIVDRDAVARMSGEIAKFGLKYIATEEELLSIHQARNDAEQTDTVNRLVLKGSDLVTALQRRVQVIKNEAIAKGTFAYNKNGVKVSVNFGITAPTVLSGTAMWSDTANSDPVGNLIQWVGDYEVANGKKPSEILITREIYLNLVKNAKVVIEAGRPTGTTRVSDAQLRDVLGSYDLPPVRIISNRKVTVKDIYSGADDVIEFYPKQRVILVGEGVGNFLFGPTVENNFQPGIVLDAYDKKEPIESVLRAVGAGFPAIENPALVAHYDVIAP